ncbi:extracellular solute-binding protein [Parapusillimonas sp. SGNA-6]|jgi:putative spermidine/putrescine transport system substrate-binding protein|nr:extracellular solute-binding protein [Parapusillimonas sp. SGNA-6]
MKGFSRRSILKMGATAMVGAAVPFVKAGNAQASTTTLRVATWGGSWRDSIDKNVSSRLAEKGIKVEYVLGNPDDNIAKLIAARRQGQVPFDVIEFTSAQEAALIRGKMLEEVDYDRIPNAKSIPDWARAPSIVAPQFTPDGIIYNADRLNVPKDKLPQRYSDLKELEVKSHLAFPNTSNVGHWSTVVGLAYDQGGSEQNMRPALDFVNALKPSFYYSASTDLAMKFGSDDIVIAPWQSSWGVRLRKSGKNVAVVYPKIGSHTGGLLPTPSGIVKGTPNSAAAHMFINEFLSPEAQAGHGLATGSVPVTREARKKMAEDPILAAMLLISDEQVENAFRVDWSKLDEMAWLQMWNRGLKR